MEQVIALALQIGLELVRTLNAQRVPVGKYLEILQRAADEGRPANNADVQEILTLQRAAIAEAEEALRRKRERDGTG
jgi:hypothetical protein